MLHSGMSRKYKEEDFSINKLSKEKFVPESLNFDSKSLKNRSDVFPYDISSIPSPTSKISECHVETDTQEGVGVNTPMEFRKPHNLQDINVENKKTSQFQPSSNTPQENDPSSNTGLSSNQLKESDVDIPPKFISPSTFGDVGNLESPNTLGDTGILKSPRTFGEVTPGNSNLARTFGEVTTVGFSNCPRTFGEVPELDFKESLIPRQTSDMRFSGMKETCGFNILSSERENLYRKEMEC